MYKPCFIFIFGIFFFKEQADIYSVIGAAIIILAAFWNGRELHKKNATLKRSNI
jgi:drug/metabolite transporter (DMT)-like permease